MIQSFQTVEVRIPMRLLLCFFCKFQFSSSIFTWLYNLFNTLENFSSDFICCVVRIDWYKNCACHEKSIEVCLWLLCLRLMCEIDFNPQRNSDCEDDCRRENCGYDNPDQWYFPCRKFLLCVLLCHVALSCLSRIDHMMVIDMC